MRFQPTRSKIDTSDKLMLKEAEVAGMKAGVADANGIATVAENKTPTGNERTCANADCEYHDQVSAGGTPCSNCKNLVKGNYYVKAGPAVVEPK